jgi:hypothetical protein
MKASARIFSFYKTKHCLWYILVDEKKRVNCYEDEKSDSNYNSCHANGGLDDPGGVCSGSAGSAE